MAPRTNNPPAAPEGVRKTKVLFFVTEDWYFWSHRLSLAKAVRDAGCEVSVVTRIDGLGEAIQREGFKLIPIALRRRSKNPLRELLTIIELIKIYRDERPAIVHHVAIKPILYGSIAAKLAKVPAVVNAFAGLGFIFVSKNFHIKALRKVLLVAFKRAFSSQNVRVIFQNPDDLNIFQDMGVISAQKSILIKGSGVDTTIFHPSAETGSSPLVVLASRMLWNKGVKEFVEAAQLLLAQKVNARFVLVGDTDPENPAAIPRQQLQSWQNNGAIQWWGKRKDMAEIFNQAHIVCLPSFYGEGVPMVLIEAAASGRPIVATDTPGCREIVKHMENGLLVPIKNSEALATALKTLIENAELRTKMGIRGRAIVVTEFTIEKVIDQTISVYRELIGPQWPQSSEKSI